ncbi:MAG: molybdenum cofactor biosynthesis protein MoaE [Asticcacaulis sp.]
MSTSKLTAILQEAAFDPSASAQAFQAEWGHAGAIVTFMGAVRPEHKGHVVDYLELDWYPGMSEASITAIGQSALDRFDIQALLIIHRCGKISAGEPIVFVAAASAHRRAAFEATDFVMDRLKTEAALWKREVGPDLDHWVEPTKADKTDLNRWSEKP